MKKQAVARPGARLNRLLAALSPPDLAALMADSSLVSLKLKKRLYSQDDPVEYVFFPLDSMISMLAGTVKPDLVETATIGHEGVVGASELLHDQPSMGVYLVQLPGTAVRIEKEAFSRHFSRIPALRNLVHQHLYALTRQIMQSAACNRLHNSQQRAARWLLMTHDRAGADTFPMTQEFLSTMLAVRRATVNTSVTSLRNEGLIHYSRGVITVRDRPGLQSASCPCYSAVWKPYNYLESGE